jgi:hypothetical protein
MPMLAEVKRGSYLLFGHERTFIDSKLPVIERSRVSISSHPRTVRCSRMKTVKIATQL